MNKLSFHQIVITSYANYLHLNSQVYNKLVTKFVLVNHFMKKIIENLFDVTQY